MCLPPNKLPIHEPIKKPIKPDLLTQCFFVSNLQANIKEAHEKIKTLTIELVQSRATIQELVDVCEAYKICLEHE